MDAAEFLKTRARICRTQETCPGCQLEFFCDKDFAEQNTGDYIAKAISAAEQWAKEHPVITRQNKLLNLFPLMGAIEDGCIDICPLLFDRSFHDRNDRGWCTENDNKVCPECKRRFWMEELKEGET